MICTRYAISALVVVAALATPAAAAPAEPASKARHAERAHPPAAVENEGGNRLCGVGATTSVTDAVPPDDEDVDTNMVVLSTNMTKRCNGILIASFSSEVYTPNEGDFIHVGMFARCLNKAGYADGCTPGERLYASPGHTYLRNTVGLPQSHGHMAMWRDLKPGKWKVEVEAGGNNSAKLGYRTLKIEAYSRK